MVEKAILVDTTKCMGCRGCQTACKQWWDLPYYPTTFSGSYQNPPDFTPYNWTIVRFFEFEKPEGGVKWVFMKDQCRHCDEPPCKAGCPVEGVIVKHPSGGVYYNVELCGKCNLQCRDYCPFGVPRNLKDENGNDIRRAFKCRFCFDRVEKGDKPLCVKTCVTGALDFGDKTAMLEKAKNRINELKNSYPEVNLYPGEKYHILWILPYKPEKFGLRSMTEKEIEERTSALKMKEVVKTTYAARSPIFNLLGLTWIAGAIGWIIDRRTNRCRER